MSSILIQGKDIIFIMLNHLKSQFGRPTKTGKLDWVLHPIKINLIDKLIIAHKAGKTQLECHFFSSSQP